MTRLSRQIEAIEYVHAADGQRYRHDFTRGDSTIDLRKDGSVVIRNAGKNLWDTFDVDGRVQPFLVNPRGVRDHTVRRTSMAGKKQRSAAQRRATKKMIAANRHRNAPRRATKHKAGKRAKKRGTGLVKYETTRSVTKRNPPPRFTGRGIIKQLGQGIVDAAWILTGKLAAQFVSSKTPFEDGTLPDIAVEVGTGIGLAFILPRFLGVDRARMVLAGNLLAPLETLVAQAKIPQISSMLTGYPALTGVDTRALFASADVPHVGKYRPNRVIGAYGPARRIGVVAAPVTAAVSRARSASVAHMMSY